MEWEPVGKVTHYFARPRVAVIRLEADIALGDRLAFQGHTTDFEQTIASMEVDHEPIESSEAGAEVAVQVDERVRKGDRVLRAGAA